MKNIKDSINESRYDNELKSVLNPLYRLVCTNRDAIYDVLTALVEEWGDEHLDDIVKGAKDFVDDNK